MSAKETLTVTLSQEEVLVILKYLELPLMMGLDGLVTEGLSSEQRRLVVSVAERSLIARNFLVPGEDGSLQVASTILAIVITCATPEWTLILTRNQPKQVSEPYFFHSRRKMAVAHTLPVSGIHQFVVFRDKEALTQSASLLLFSGPHKAIPCPDGRLPDSQISAAREAALKNGAAGASAILERSGLHPQTAQQLALSLAQPVANITVVRLWHRSEGTNADGFTVLQGDNGLWLLRPMDTQSEYVALYPVSSEEIVRAFSTLAEDEVFSFNQLNR